MLNEVLAYLHNYFMIKDAEQVGTFIVSDGSITLQNVKDGQYFLICGSIFNDGVHKYPATDLVDEQFEGHVFPLAVPPDLVSISDEMEAWQEKNGNPGAYQSESFGGYSYSRATSSSGGLASCFDAFSSRLKRWKKI